MPQGTGAPRPKRTGFMAAALAVAAARRFQDGGEQHRLMLSADQSLERGKIDLAEARKMEAITTAFEDGLRDVKRREVAAANVQHRADALESRCHVRLRMQRRQLEKAEDDKRLFLDYTQNKDFRGLLSACDFGTREIKRRAALRRKEKRKQEQRGGAAGDGDSSLLTSADDTVLSSFLASGSCGSTPSFQSPIMRALLTPRSGRLLELRELARSGGSEGEVAARHKQSSHKHMQPHPHPRHRTCSKHRRHRRPSPVRDALEQQQSMIANQHNPRMYNYLVTRCVDRAAAVYNQQQGRSAAAALHHAMYGLGAAGHMDAPTATPQYHRRVEEVDGGDDNDDAAAPLHLPDIADSGRGRGHSGGGHDDETSNAPPAEPARAEPTPEEEANAQRAAARAARLEAHRAARREYLLQRMEHAAKRRLAAAFYYELMLYGPAKQWDPLRVRRARLAVMCKRNTHGVLAQYYAKLRLYKRDVHGRVRRQRRQQQPRRVAATEDQMALAAERGLIQQERSPQRWPECRGKVVYSVADQGRSQVADIERRHRDALAHAERDAGLRALHMQLQPERESKQRLRDKWSKFHAKVVNTYTAADADATRGSTHPTWPLRRYSSTVTATTVRSQPVST